MFREIFLKKIASLKYGKIIVIENNTTHCFGELSDKPMLQATITILDNRFYRDVILGGTKASAEGYFLGYWESDNLTDLMRILILNQDTLKKIENNFYKFMDLISRFSNIFIKNSISRSKKNIALHYDLSNDFFKTFLDDNLMYSCAIFKDIDSDLNAASKNKLDIICKKLSLNSQDKVLEIGTGWGGFAIYVAEKYGCDVVTTTISDQQYELTKARIKENNLTHKITVLKQDYRELTGEFDKLVSIEMIEAVGYQFYQDFFKQCSKLLKPDGEMLIQSITIQDAMYEHVKNEIDFIKHYIFPGSCIPSATVLLQEMTKSSDLRLFHLQDIGLHYAPTLRAWHDRFLKHNESIKRLGFSEQFIRLWTFYFCYCEAGFREGYLSDIQLHCVKPLAIRKKNYLNL